MIDKMVGILKFSILVLFPLMFSNIIIYNFPNLFIVFPSTVVIATIRLIKSPQTVFVSLNPFSLIIKFYVWIANITSLRMIHIICYPILIFISIIFFIFFILIDTLIIIFFLLLLCQACILFCQLCY